jgi:hypothetical protein
VATAVQWLCSSVSSSKKYRVFDVFGADATMRTEVLMEIERRVGAVQRVALSAAEVPVETIWQTLARAPLAGVSSRVVVVSSCERIRDWSGLKKFVQDRVSFAETTLVLVSDRAEPGRRVRVSDKHIRGKYSWVTELTEWEVLIKDYTAGTYIQCSTPTVDVSVSDGLSSVARWFSLRVPVSQRQAEYLWSRAGENTALARDVLEQLRVLGLRDAKSIAESEFKSMVNVALTLHGAVDFAEALLFGRRELALASLMDHSFSTADWSKVLGYLSQRLDWLGPLHVALATNEVLSQVERRLNIHRKWILHYAHREDQNHNIARHYDKARVRRCRTLLGDLDSVLSPNRPVPPGFGEVLISCW